MAYAVAVLALPFVADQDLPVEAFFVVWLGGSALAGALAPHYWMLAIPIGVLVIHFAVMVLGLSDSEFLTDPLSIIGLYVLAAGEIGGLLVGSTLTKTVRRAKA